MATLLTQIKVRRGTAAALDAMSPVLAVGEPAFSTDTHRFAIGDGEHSFSELALRIKDGVTNVSGATNCINQIAVFSSNAGDDIVGRNVTISNQAVMAGVTQIQINNAENNAPLTINKPVLVTNLNADLLDGKQGSAYFTSDNLGFQKTPTKLPVAIDNNKLYVDIESVASNAQITLTGSDISITNNSFTLNQAEGQTITLAVAKNSSGARAQNSIVSAVADGTIQSHNYQLSYTASATSDVHVGATMVYDQALKAIKFVF
jgi:hypothetical protein